MPSSTAATSNRRAAIWAGLLILYVVWGSTYLGIRIAVETIPPFTMAAVRFLIAGLVLLTWSVAREGRSFRRPTVRQWRDTFIVGALLLGGGMGLVAWGEQTVPSGITALLIALMPVWVAVLGRVFFAERLPRAAVAGVAIGLAGVAILVGPSDNPVERFAPTGIAALIVSPMCWSSGSLFSAHRAELPVQPLVATGGQMLSGALVLTAFALATGEPARLDLRAISPASIGALAYLTVIGSLVAFTTYVALLRIAPLPLIATYAYVNPVVAVILGWLVLGEPLTPRTIVAGGVIVFAVALIITARGRMKQPEPLPDAVPQGGSPGSASPAATTSSMDRDADRRSRPAPGASFDS
jgi:drug/metabolite transporter (DMT)-like permease